MASTFRGGIRINDHKTTKYSKTVDMPAPAVVHIPLPKQSDIPFTLSVKEGQNVFKGQIIAFSGDGYRSIHATVSGKVRHIEAFLDKNGEKSHRIIIENDFLDTLDPSIAPYPIPLANTTSEEIIELVKNAGITDPSAEDAPIHAKISSALKKAKSLIINCTETEPYITSTHRLLAEDPQAVIGGALILMKALHLAQGVLAVDAVKTDVIHLLKTHLKHHDMLKVQTLQTKYPQGNDRQLVFALEKRELPHGKHPSDLGFCIFHAETCAKIYFAFVRGYPQTDRIVTVSGDCIQKPQNLRVAIGTPVSEVIKFCGGFKEDPEKIILGGVMTGAAVTDLDTPVANQTTAVLALSDDILAPEIKDPVCIHCGACHKVCPERLMPNYFAAFSEKSLYERSLAFHIQSCMECGCCSFVCPAGIPLAKHIRATKQKLEETKSTQK